MAFKTKGGRVVYDGGGIDPDIKTKKEYLHDVTIALMTQGVISDFANEFVLKNQKPSNAASFNFGESDYEKFIQFSKNKKFEYDSELEKSIKKIKEVAEEDKSLDLIKSQYEALIQKVKDSKQEQLKINKKEISELLENEIIRRYYNRTAVIERSFIHDEDVKAAIRLINTPSEYSKILKK